MNYIGSKNKLSSWIIDSVQKTIPQSLENMVFCDLFAGTGIVGRKFKPFVKQVIANDVEYYSYILLQNYIGNNQNLGNSVKRIDFLNQLPPKKGFIAKEYGENGESNRMFFSQANAEKIDAIRLQIEAWKNAEEITQQEYYFFLCSLLESADKVANTASVYGAFLKKIKASAVKPLVLKAAEFQKTTGSHQVFQEDANSLIKKISGDILYLDPPYNARQYGANYHLLNTIARYQNFEPKGKTGLPNYYKSLYCKKAEVGRQLEELLKNADFKYIFLSYNNEGLLSSESIKQIMEKFGKYSLETTTYQRFKADKTENRQHKATGTTEFLHILQK